MPRLLAVMDGSEITRGGQSWLEREVLSLLDRAGLPLPATQAHLGRARRHADPRRLPTSRGLPIVVEALGYRWHRTGAQMRIDSDRMNRLQLDGFIVLQFTYEPSRGRTRAGVIRETIEALAAVSASKLCVSVLKPRSFWALSQTSETGLRRRRGPRRLRASRRGDTHRGRAG